MAAIINEMPISDHHTVFHFLFLKSIFNIGNLFTHNVNIIVGMISFVQMVLVVATFSYTLVFLNSRKLTKKVSNIILIYYALFPINAIYNTNNSYGINIFLHNTFFKKEKTTKYINNNYIVVLRIITS